MSTFHSERLIFFDNQNRDRSLSPFRNWLAFWSKIHMVPPSLPLKSIYSSLPEEKKRVNFPHEMTNTACCERGTNILYLKGDSGSSLSFPFPIVSWLNLAEKSVS